MEGLFSLLLFAAFFYFMMRFGCGSHMTHGNHDVKQKSKNNPIIDPVCGLVVSEDEGYGKLHSGNLYRFCSKKCLDTFDHNPERFIEQAENNSMTRQEHNHDA